MTILSPITSRRGWCVSMLAPFAMALIGCGGEDLATANPKPVEKRGKYLDINPPPPDPNAKPKKGARKPKR